MSFFEIRKYSGRNFNLVQKNHFFVVITGIIESKTLAILQCMFCLKLRLTFTNFILNTIKYLFVLKNLLHSIKNI